MNNRLRNHRTSLVVACVLLVQGIVLNLCSLAQARAADAAAAPTAEALLTDYRLALAPSHARAERVLLRFHDGNADTKTWLLDVAQRRDADGPRAVMVIRAPSETAGTALLAAPTESGGALWFYAPSERRVREMVPLEAGEHLFGTDFTYADVAMTTPVTAPPRLLAPTEIAGHRSYAFETRPKDNSEWQFSRIVTYLDADTKLPLRREYFDRANRLWKVATFRTAVIDGTPTVISEAMQDVQSHSASEWRLEALRYDTEIPRDFFDARTLDRAPSNALWRALGEGQSPS